MKSALILVAALPLLAQQKAADNCAPPPSALAPTLPAQLLPGIGVVHLPMTTASPEAQKFFDQGVAQMYSFWAREAERSFLQAAALDPSAPMPYWGIAMVAARASRSTSSNGSRASASRPLHPVPAPPPSAPWSWRRSPAKPLASRNSTSPPSPPAGTPMPKS